jgi:hypothetical protein
MINDKDGHIPSPLIILTSTALCHAPLEWQKNKSVHLRASKSKLKADRPDRSTCFNPNNDGSKIASCYDVMDRKLLTSPGIGDTYTFLMNTCNTLPESYQHSVYNNTLAIVNHPIELAENPTRAVVISMEVVSVDNAILLDYLASEVALEEPDIGNTDPNIPIDNNCTDNKHHFGMPGGSGDYDDEGNDSDQGNAIPTASGRRWPATDPERFDLGTSDVDRYEGEDGDDADADAVEEEESSQVNDGSTHNVED